MLYVEKDNRQYCITEDEKQKFIDLGYRVGRLVGDKLVFEEVEEDGEVEELIKERTVLKGQLTKANNRIAELEKELEETKGKGK